MPLGQNAAIGEGAQKGGGRARRRLEAECQGKAAAVCTAGCRPYGRGHKDGPCRPYREDRRARPSGPEASTNLRRVPSMTSTKTTRTQVHATQKPPAVVCDRFFGLPVVHVTDLAEALDMESGVRDTRAAFAAATLSTLRPGDFSRPNGGFRCPHMAEIRLGRASCFVHRGGGLSLCAVLCCGSA